MQWDKFEHRLACQSWQMSGHERPSAVRQETVNPALSEENRVLQNPVTPTVSNEDRNPFAQSAPQPTAGVQGLPGKPPPHILEATGANGHADPAAGVQNGEDLLRRLSLTGTTPSRQELQSFDPHATHPNLTLSGNIISAAFCVPYKIGYTTSGEWVGITQQVLAST